MSMRIVHELPPDAWDAYVYEHPQGNIFHTRTMFEVWNRAKEYHPRLWASVSGDAILALFIPVEINLADGLLRSLMTRMVSFGSLLYVPNAGGMEAVDELIRVYKREGGGNSLFTELRHCSSMEAVHPVLEKNGFAIADHLNYLIDLTRSPEEIWNQLSKSIRKHIHAAQRKNLVVEEVTDQGQFQVVYDLLKTTYKRIHVPLPSQSFFRAAFQVLLPMGMLKAHVIRADGVPISTRLALVYKDQIVDWYTGSDRAFEKMYPEEFIIWQTLQWGAVHGYRVFDFGGAGQPNEYYGPRVFKEKFGGALVNFGRSTHIHHPIRLALSKVGYTLLKRLL
jgi:hypothetical protein